MNEQVRAEIHGHLNSLTADVTHRLNMSSTVEGYRTIQRSWCDSPGYWVEASMLDAVDGTYVHA